MDGSVLTGLAGAGGSLLGEAFNALSQGATNRSQQNFAWDMYNRQRQDALSDWNMQNQYNLPSAQMERFKQAGLNPNLIYGRGDSGSASSVRSSSGGSYNPKAPQMDLGSVMSQFVDLTRTVVQTDNLRTQKDLILADIRNKEAMAHQYDTRSELNEITGERMQSLLPYQQSLLSSQVRATEVSADFKIHEDTRRWLYEQMAERKTDVSVKQAVSEIALNYARANGLIPQQIAELKARINNLDSQTELNAMEDQMRAKGISWHDPLWERTVVNEVKSFFNDNWNVQDRYKIPDSIRRNFPVGTQYKGKFF